MFAQRFGFKFFIKIIFHRNWIIQYSLSKVKWRNITFTFCLWCNIACLQFLSYHIWNLSRLQCEMWVIFVKSELQKYSSSKSLSLCCYFGIEENVLRNIQMWWHNVWENQYLFWEFCWNLTFFERMYLKMGFRQSCTARRTRILVGNKIDLERSRQVSNKGETRQILTKRDKIWSQKKKIRHRYEQ